MEELPHKLNDINTHFKITAGPGAGKTTWLVGHLQNVLKTSDQINIMQKIACVTYTRVGSETVNKKVKEVTGTNRIDSGTIHSFLYRNVIKPFSFLIEKDDNGDDLFNIRDLIGHIENRPSHDRVSSWINDIGNRYRYLIKDNESRLKTFELLKECEWQLGANGHLNCKLKKNYHRDLKFPSSKLYEYKLANWRKSIMHHEDVLYFTHYIFNKESRIIEYVSNKFPYIFLDEFQDTTPLQTWIIKKIAKQGSVIGVIGDPAQSIFEFAGAKRKDFKDFSLHGIINYRKSINYRSTTTIINFLKHLRDDIEQTPKKDATTGEPVKIIVGDATEAVDYIKQLDSDNFAVLCRYNKDVNCLRLNLKEVKGDNLIDLLYSQDSNYKRPAFIHSLIKAYDYKCNGEFREAINEIKKQLKGIDTEGLARKKLIIEIIEYLDNNQTTTVAEIYNFWQKILKGKYSFSLTGLRSAKDVHKNAFEKFIPFLSKRTKIHSKIRTIHQSKGDEFENVLVCLFDKKDKNGKITKGIDSLLNDYLFESKVNINKDSTIGEETRLLYVACSRAKKGLFINIPQLSANSEKQLTKFNVTIDVLGESAHASAPDAKSPR
ncbi:MAG: UvrD-helicase domain-containing protein [Candidatus Muiribacteriota bacterium]